jgi:hypothetical protein
VSSGSPLSAKTTLVEPPAVKRGLVHVFFAYDVGLSIDLTACQQHISDMTELAHIKHKGHAPQYFQFDPPPLRVTQEIAPLEIGAYRTSNTTDMVLYDFGGASVRYTIPFSGSFDELIDLSVRLSASALLSDDARQRVAHVLAVIEGAVLKPGIAAVSEDYIVFEIDEFDGPVAPSELGSRHADALARLLRSENDPLSEQEVSDALANRVSFGASDVAIIDWNAALLYDREPEDVLTVLEFANIQLLEVRFLDSQLDKSLDRAYEGMNIPRSWKQRRLPSDARAYLKNVAQMQVDGAILFERVSNALKLLGDQYLARVYRSASQRYRLNEWNAGILRKLETIDSIYQKVHDQSTGVRMELMEWIVIVLIAVELVLSLVTAIGPRH